MISKLNVIWIRWALLIVNAAVLSFFAMQAVAFFWSGSDEQVAALPDAAGVKFEPREHGGKGQGSLQTICGDLSRHAPVAVEPPKPLPVADSKPKPGGELDGWKILSVIDVIDGPNVAFVDGIEAGGDPAAAASAKDKRSSANRLRPPKRSGTAARGATTTKHDTMIEGQKFRNYPVTIREITLNPDTVTYVHDATNQLYKLEREEARADFSQGLKSIDPDDAPALRELPFEPEEIGKSTDAPAETMKKSAAKEAEKPAAPSAAGDAGAGAAGGAQPAPAEPAAGGAAAEGTGTGSTPAEQAPASGTQENPQPAPAEPAPPTEGSGTEAPPAATPPGAGDGGGTAGMAPARDAARADIRKNRNASKQRSDDEKTLADFKESMEKLTPAQREQVQRALEGKQGGEK